MNSVLITGAFGQLGLACSNILKSKYNVIKTGLTPVDISNKLDISSTQDVKNFLDKYNPDIILNLAAMTDVDGCEQNPKRANQINCEGVMNLCDGFKGHFIQLSTDYVFNGASGPYVEDDPTDAISVYGQSKLDAEQYLMDSKIDYTIIRANVLYSYAPDTKASFLKWVVESLKNSKKINVVSDQWSNPTSTNSLAEFIDRISLSKAYGLYHYADKGVMSRFEFAQLIAKVFGLDSSLINPISSSDLNQVAARPLKSGLSTQKIENELLIQPPSVEASLSNIYNSLKS